MNKLFGKTTQSSTKSSLVSPLLHRGLLSLCLLTSLAACATAPELTVPIVTAVQTVQIPQVLTQPTEPAVCRLATNGDLVDCIKAYDGQLQVCNGDKASIVEYMKDPK